MFFKNYYNPGKGVDKNETPKKGIALFWELFTVDFWSFLGLNMLYVIVCIPIVTIGGATIAYNKLCCNLIDRKHVFIYHDFIKYFKENFLEGILLTFLIIFTLADLMIIYTNVFVYIQTLEGLQAIFVWALALMFCSFIVLVVSYLIPMMANLDISLINKIKNSILLIFLGGPISIVMAAINIGIFILFFNYFPVSITPFLVFGFYVLFFTNCFFIWPVVRKYSVKSDDEADEASEIIN